MKTGLHRLLVLSPSIFVVLTNHTGSNEKQDSRLFFSLYHESYTCLCKAVVHDELVMQQKNITPKLEHGGILVEESSTRGAISAHRIS